MVILLLVYLLDLMVSAGAESISAKAFSRHSGQMLWVMAFSID
jgi:hypothetical protein